MAEFEASGKIDGVVVVTPGVHGDERGVFVETYRRSWFPHGREMVQANRSDKQAGAVVGLHFHLHQADYWYVPRGRARVVLHDLRTGSPTEKATLELEIGDHDHRGVWIPPGVAHGFGAMTDLTMTYLVDQYYNPADELGVAWDDPDIGASWGLPPGISPVLSARDKANPSRSALAVLPRVGAADLRFAAPHYRGGVQLLVTGGAGFIGSNFVRHALAAGHGAVVYDSLTYAGDRRGLADLEGRFAFVEADIGDAEAAEAALRDHAVDAVVNFAAESHNSLAVVDPGRFFRTNVLGTQTLLEAARRAGTARFHHVSTCEVYGDLALDSDEKFHEDSPYRPRTPYNASKAGADHAVRAYYETYGMAVTITNCCNNYGPFQFPEKIIPLFSALAIDDQPLPLYASTANRREWLHVDDHCRAILRVLDDGRIGETYHVGSGIEASIDEIADGVLAALDKPASLKSIVPDRPGHDRRYLLDSTRIRTELGWAPAVDFASGLPETVRWYAAHRDWWEPLRGRAPVVESSAWSGR